VRKGAKKAIVAISHKLIIAAYQVLNKKEAYKTPLLNDKKQEEKRKAKSVQKHLVELSKLGFTVRLTPVS
jgi:transposase